MKRGSFKTDGVILKSIDYGDSDRIITFYSKGSGKHSAIAKGARRSKRRFVGNIDPLCYSRLNLFYNGKSDLLRIDDASLIDGFPLIKADIESYGSACYVVELAGEMTEEAESNPLVFAIIVGFLRIFDKLGAGDTSSTGSVGGATGIADAALTGDREVLLRFFEVKLLAALGYLPHLDGCVVCRDEIGEDGNADMRLYFDSDKGGVVCACCVPGFTSAIPVSAGTARFLSTASKLTMDKLLRLTPGRNFIDEGDRVMSSFIRYQLGKELKSRKFMDKMKGAAAAF
ncbi:DNA recombination and repair protein RecO [hydrothermal vent metagenome]|uniref:DNA repair protein RecO n=1 Tax=hydrothermal vent metagenome TaxID=652676 RepID=A0A3B0QN09_9ZZZZ